jgi:hypothetical protein
MSELYLHLETGLDHEAARRCGYSAATAGVPPLHLLQIRAAAALRIEYPHEQEHGSDLDLRFHLSSWAVTPPYDCGEPVDEGDILEQLRVQCALSERIVTFGGRAFEKPLLHLRCLVHGLDAGSSQRQDRPHAVWSFRQGEADPLAVAAQSELFEPDPGHSIASYCAPLRIPTAPSDPESPDPYAPVAPGRPGAAALRAEASVTALWLLDQFWSDGTAEAVKRWAVLRGTIESNPNLSHLRRLAIACPEVGITPKPAGSAELNEGVPSGADNVVPINGPSTKR